MYGAAPYGVQNAYSPVQPMGAWGIQGQGAPSPYGVPGGRPEWETFYDDQGTPYYSFLHIIFVEIVIKMHDFF